LHPVKNLLTIRSPVFTQAPSAVVASMVRHYQLISQVRYVDG
jgi:hypothetical protein